MRSARPPCANGGSVSIASSGGVGSPSLAGRLSGISSLSWGRASKEVTASELEAEATATGLSSIDKQTRDQLLRRVIDRHLLAETARKEGLDRTPSYLSQRHRMEQALLASLVARAAAEATAAPSRDEAAQFARKNPALFGQNEVLLLQIIKFSPANALTRREIAAIKTLPEAERLLTGRAKEVSRGVTVAEMRSMQPALASMMRRLTAGEIFFLVDKGVGVFGSIANRRAAPVPDQQALEVARKVLEQERGSAAVKALLDDQRRAAKIDYQAGYGNDSGPSEQGVFTGSIRNAAVLLGLLGIILTAGWILLLVRQRYFGLDTMFSARKRVYRLYLIHPEQGHLESREKVMAADDAEAIAIAEAETAGRLAELWRGGRKVHTFGLADS